MRIGCARLEEALALLRGGGGPPLAPGLEADIIGALSELRAACVLEQLKVDLEPPVPYRLAGTKVKFASPKQSCSLESRSISL